MLAFLPLAAALSPPRPFACRAAPVATARVLFEPALQPSARRGAPLLMLAGRPDVPFASAYEAAELQALWNALKKCYGTEALAREAVGRQPQVMAPVYATPALLTQSRDALVKLLGKEEALEVMLKNPMVLTCGGRELAASDPDDVRSTANVRFYLDKYVNPAGLGVLLAFLGLLKVIGLVVAKQQGAS
mmetsp:Transcript_61417/g.182952  ORF Transcript_61417/g.182952 Transcript_61417/m.182952 type:complete len:189 (-) Transcript_61417:208-774(-)